MICPYRKRTVIALLDHSKDQVTTEEYMPCYEEACPFFEESHKWDGQMIPSSCNRAYAEQEGKAVNK